jgi:hypothetical protein
MISLNFIDSVKLVNQEMESNLRKKREEKTVRERKGDISIKLTIAVPAEEFQKNRVSVIETMAHTVSAVREHSQSQHSGSGRTKRQLSQQRAKSRSSGERSD